MSFFVFFLSSVSPPHIRSAFTSKLQQLYKEERPRKVRSGKQVVGRSTTGYQLCLGVSLKRHISVELKVHKLVKFENMLEKAYLRQARDTSFLTKTQYFFKLKPKRIGL